MDRLRKIREEAVEAARQQAERDPTRPGFHFRPHANWMNDVCAAFVHSGWHHIFYQSTPLQDAAPIDYGWGACAEPRSGVLGDPSGSAHPGSR